MEQKDEKRIETVENHEQTDNLKQVVVEDDNPTVGEMAETREEAEN